ncbi:MAG: hydroxyacid dehydrogenase, partial [Gammaproteobacteria bacterium]|nr:hydroxyacid dehydrogenase [Gammaproteobacteria bacterium]
MWETVCGEVNLVADRLGGSFSAEHGIGLLKVPELRRLRGGVELDLMRAIKHALDPAGIMNPGKLLGD